ncbi:GntR family transcriptional regulator [Sulfitobacter sp. SK012]|uniref:GntR family transcriptional regulator n=1 Tax=Sulfitobacter sp. SK012 TaxID=1389005 RepID=UPI002672E00D|nr:GntR family transcriptional regulator [Sulfitobacter sp. SK012]
MLTDKTAAAEAIQAQLLRRICFLEYLPGDQLKEAELAAEFGVSRTPVRDAINRINHLGLVETRNGVGTVVVALTAEKIHHVYEMRLELAKLIGNKSARAIRADDLEAAQSLLDEAAILTENFHPRNYVELNHRVHELIASLIENSVLNSFWWQTYYQAASTWYRSSERLGPDAGRALVHELGDTVAALKNNDADAIGFIQRTHIGYGYSGIKAQLCDQSTDKA